MDILVGFVFLYIIFTLTMMYIYLQPNIFGAICISYGMFCDGNDFHIIQ